MREEGQMKGEAESVYEALRQDLIRLNANWQIYIQLFTVSEERYTVFNATAPGFFKLLQDVLVDNAVISLSRLTDPAHFQSLPRLVKLIKSQVSPAFHRELSSDLAELRSACEDIRTHRNKRVAHKAVKPGEPHLEPVPTKLPSLTRKKIEQAMASSANLLNKVLAHFEDKEQLYVPIIRGDADALFHFVEKGYTAGEAEKQAWLAQYAKPKSA
jgi:hypothetical protein